MHADAPYLSKRGPDGRDEVGGQRSRIRSHSASALPRRMRASPPAAGTQEVPFRYECTGRKRKTRCDGGLRVVERAGRRHAEQLIGETGTCPWISVRARRSITASRCPSEGPQSRPRSESRDYGHGSGQARQFDDDALHLHSSMRLRRRMARRRILAWRHRMEPEEIAGRRAARKTPSDASSCRPIDVHL